MKKRKILKLTLLLAGVFVIWFGVGAYRCKRRTDAFKERVEQLTREADDELKIGTKRPNVIRFFQQRQIHFEFYGDEAVGTLYTAGCSPLGCGKDTALIGVRVHIDQAGAVISQPIVAAIYTDCL